MNAFREEARELCAQVIVAPGNLEYQMIKSYQDCSCLIGKGCMERVGILQIGIFQVAQLWWLDTELNKNIYMFDTEQKKNT